MSTPLYDGRFINLVPLDRTLNKTLVKDQRKFPYVPDPNGKSNRPATVVDARYADISDWQKACEASLIEMQAYRIEAETEAAAATAAPTPASVGNPPTEDPNNADDTGDVPVVVT